MPDETLADFISNQGVQGDEILEVLYTTALKNIASQTTDRRFVPDCCRVLGAIAMVRDPLPATALANLLGENLDMVAGIIQRLDCLLVTHVSDTPVVRVIHASLARWLVSPSNKTQWAVSSVFMHRHLAVRSLSLMNETLCMDILGLSNGDIYKLPYPVWADIPNQEVLINLNIPLELQYACEFWISHLLELKAEEELHDQAIMIPLSHMMTRKPLEWVEVLAYLKKLNLAVTIMENLHKWLQNKSVPVSIISNHVYDVRRFIQAYAAGISESPLHIYLSGLVFTPQNTTLYEGYHEHVHRLPVKLVQGYEFEWRRVVNTIVGHEGGVNALAFSPDGHPNCIWVK
jgi:hypothetical protein